jgi:hypothetical protein
VSPRALWAGRTKFAEYAEALGITTEEVMAAMETPAGSACVLYSLGVDDDAPIRRAIFGRDEGGVLELRAVTEVGTLAGFQARVEELMVEWEEEQR